MSIKATLYLEKETFSFKQRPLVDFQTVKAFGFKYESGIRAVKIQNERGSFILLPYKGQMIWDAEFDGRRLTMKSLFSEPKQADFFLDSYGNLLQHCGALRMGCPSVEDDHPLHGELPYADYDKAFVELGEDDGGKYLGISGIYEYNRAYGSKYRARPCVKLYEGASVMDIFMTVENLSQNPMELMYMCHINFSLAPNARILQSADWDNVGMVLRTTVPEHITPSDEWYALIKRIGQDVTVTRTIRPDDNYDTDVCFFINRMDPDELGWAHFLQVHEDGSADLVSQKPSELDHHTRWLLRDRSMEVFGMLPATCDPEGYTTEKKKGNIRILDPGGSVTFSIRAGYLDSSTVKKMKKAESVR